MFLMHKEQRLGLKLHSNATIIALTGILADNIGQCFQNMLTTYLECSACLDINWIKPALSLDLSKN